MEYRLLGRSDFQVPVFMLGTGNFGGKGGVYDHRGSTDVATATQLVDICLDAGLTMFDTADAYAGGASEETLGAAIKGRRGRVLISTKGGMRVGPGDDDVGNTRAHLTKAVDASLTRLGTDVIDLYQLHIYDALVPVDETLGALDDLIRAGKLRQIGASNFTGWQLMKGLAASDAHGFARYAAHQAYYSLVGRDYEQELMPLALDQGVGCVAWSPLGWGRLTGKIRRGSPMPEQSRLHADARAVPTVDSDYLYRVVDALDAVVAETGKTVPQIALNWMLGRPSVSSIVIGARDEAQLKANLGALGWSLTKAQVAALDAASALPLSYPYWHQAAFPERNPPAV
jgi:aryl-alcohol dehydrogenase-like predicted oxidoreductase